MYERFLSEVAIGSFLDICYLEDEIKSPDFDETGEKVFIPNTMAGKFLDSEIPSVAEMGVIKTIYSHKNQSEILNRFYELVEDAQLFVFEEFEKEPELQRNERGKLVVPVEIDLPFKTCAFEVYPRLDDTKFAVLIHEKSPKLYEVFVMSLMRKSGKISASYYRPGSSYKSWETTLHIDALLQRLSREEAGMEEINIREKVGIGQNRRRLGIIKLIRIAPTAARSKVAALGKKQIDWSHRWFVRGHWRKATGLGKDRSGNYVVQGFTWVVSHEKGPEEAALVAKKTRLIKAVPRADTYESDQANL